MFTQFSLGILTSGIFSFAIYHSIRDRKHLKYLGQYEDLKKKLTQSEYRELSKLSIHKIASGEKDDDMWGEYSRKGAVYARDKINELYEKLTK